jgi:hypothetical protein
VLTFTGQPMEPGSASRRVCSSVSPGTVRDQNWPNACCRHARIGRSGRALRRIGQDLLTGSGAASPRWNRDQDARSETEDANLRIDQPVKCSVHRLTASAASTIVR